MYSVYNGSNKLNDSNKIDIWSKKIIISKMEGT